MLVNYDIIADKIPACGCSVTVVMSLRNVTPFFVIVNLLPDGCYTRLRMDDSSLIG
jgi:hypothetical protein